MGLLISVHSITFMYVINLYDSLVVEYKMGHSGVFIQVESLKRSQEKKDGKSVRSCTVHTTTFASVVSCSLQSFLIDQIKFLIKWKIGIKTWVWH